MKAPTREPFHAEFLCQTTQTRLEHQSNQVFIETNRRTRERHHQNESSGVGRGVMDVPIFASRCSLNQIPGEKSRSKSAMGQHRGWRAVIREERNGHHHGRASWEREPSSQKCMTLCSRLSFGITIYQAV
jgi:hypothetical protein